MPHILRHQSTDQLRNALTGGNFLGSLLAPNQLPFPSGPPLPRTNLPYPTGGPPPQRRNLPFTPDMVPQTRNLPFPGIPGDPAPFLRPPPPSWGEPFQAPPTRRGRLPGGLRPVAPPSRRRRPPSPPTERAKPAAPTRRRRVGATDVAGTAKRKPTTTRGSGRKTVVKGDPVRSTRKPPTPQQRAIKTGQAGRTARARRKSSL